MFVIADTTGYWELLIFVYIRAGERKCVRLSDVPCVFVVVGTALAKGVNAGFSWPVPTPGRLERDGWRD